MKQRADRLLLRIYFAPYGRTEQSDCVIEVEDDNSLDDRNMKPTLYFAKTMMMIELLIYEYYRISIK